MNSRKKMMNEPSSEKQRWSLRKLSVGMTSVLLGTTMFWASGTGSQVKADTTTASEQAAQTQTNTAEKAAGTESTEQTEDNNANADAGKTAETAAATDNGSQETTTESTTASSSTQNQGQEADTQEDNQAAQTTSVNMSDLSGQGDANAADLTVSKASKMTSSQSTGSTPDKNGVNTSWTRDKSANTGNSDTNSEATEAGEYWPETKNQSLKDSSEATTVDDFTADALKGKLDDNYSSTPLAKYNRDVSLYIKGKKVDLNDSSDAPTALTNDDK